MSTENNLKNRIYLRGFEVDLTFLIFRLKKLYVRLKFSDKVWSRYLAVSDHSVLRKAEAKVEQKEKSKSKSKSKNCTRSRNKRKKQKRKQK